MDKVRYLGGKTQTSVRFPPNLIMDPKKARTYMQQAIEEMKKSVSEPRTDKISPKVGAVLVKPDGTVEMAHRGELRNGDHAEYTLLERKNRATKLDGSTLFATLEPCASGSRQHPKLICAERIVLARIHTVWIGVEDPDPTVAGQGKSYLEQHGIDVQIFDRDLQEEITKANEDFLRQARIRAEAVRKEAAPPTPSSSLEDIIPVSLGFLSEDALESYRLAIGEREDIHSQKFLQRLGLQGLVKNVDGEFNSTGFGALLFGKNPRDIIPQAGLLATIHYEDGKEEVRNFEGPLVFVPDQVLAWLRDKLPNPIDRTSAQRKEVNHTLFELVREGVVNALVHRDYSNSHAKCQLKVTPDILEIWSPGRPIKPITVEQMQDFSAPMLSRNPILHFIFSQMKLAEERGLGLNSMQRKAERGGLPLPRYHWNDPYLVLTFLRSAESATNVLGQDVLAALTATERRGWSWLSMRKETTSSEYAKALGVSPRTALNHLQKFTNLKLLVHAGSGRSTKYEVVA